MGRVLLARPRFGSIGAVREEIQRREGAVSLSQVSKVLTALEDDLIVRKGEDGVKLIQPERLLDLLVSSYRRPDAIQEADLKADLGPALFASLTSKARAAKARIAGYEPARYVVAPESRERLVVYVESRGFSSLGNLPQPEGSRRFANLTIRAIKEPLVFFDTQEDSGFKWCSPLETYLHLMQGGKREQESAAQLREEILDKATSIR